MDQLSYNWMKNMYLYLIWTIKYSDKFTEIKYNTWKSSAVGHTMYTRIVTGMPVTTINAYVWNRSTSAIPACSSRRKNTVSLKNFDFNFLSLFYNAIHNFINTSIVLHNKNILICLQISVTIAVNGPIWPNFPYNTFILGLTTQY